MSFWIVALAMIAAWIIACYISTTVHFFTKVFFYGFCLVVSSTIGAIFCIHKGRSTDNHYVIFSLFQRSVAWMNVKITIENEELLESDEAYVIVANHQAALDVYTMTHVWPKNCTVILKSSLKFVPGFNLCTYLCNSIYINRFNKERAHKSISSAEEAIIKHKRKVFMYPEGTRNADGGLLPFKKGAFVIAKATNVPILPCVFSSYKPFYDYAERKFGPGEVIIRVLPKIYPDNKSVEQLSDECRKVMLDALESVNKKDS